MGQGGRGRALCVLCALTVAERGVECTQPSALEGHAEERDEERWMAEVQSWRERLEDGGGEGKWERVGELGGELIYLVKK